MPSPQAPYSLAVQSVAILAQFATAFSALSQGVSGGQGWLLLSLVVVNLAALLFLPVRRLPRWAQLIFLSVQGASAIVSQTVVPAQVIGYLYLVIVLQAIVLLPLWLWIPLAVVVYAIWSGLLAIATANFFLWLQGNLALAFPATCAIIAAIVYVRQQRRSEQVQQMLAQVQQRYDALAGSMREFQQRAMLEERHRLAETVVGEVQGALSRTEQSLNAALSQAQSNLGRLQSTVSQTRAAAAQTVERLRGAISALRYDAAEPPPAAPLTLVGASDEAVLSRRSNAVLTWVLPSVFVAFALLLTVLQGQWALETLGALALCSVLLLLAYVGTQATRNPVLLQAGLIGQTLVVLAMTLISHTLPMLLGLLLILWQLALRLPLAQIVLYLASLPTAALVLADRLSPTGLGFDTLLVGAVASMAVGAPLLMARRQLDRRKQAELQLALLSAEIELQTGEVRALAVAAERTRLAREVHDDLGSRLMLVTLQLQLAEELAAEDPAAALDQLQVSREQLREAWRGVLAVADAELPLGCTELPAALRELSARAGATSVELDGELAALPAPVAATVFRSVQEGLTNVRKHAGQVPVAVQVVEVCGYVTVTVSNDPPVDTSSELPTVAYAGSFGLIGLRERAEALGGALEAGPTAEGGWRLKVVLPAEGA